ncbi:hypothetical protein SBA3_3530011 [Candidatus Sulfopaludibacter sp. SbA3]|nr:hypothetical protein SBA3_3530011 [Candidatus Sulfopaludibacter sp. SbA3]
MLKNRSVPADVLLPHVVYPDVEEAIAWLGKAFGFQEHYRYGDPVSGAQVHLGGAWIMLRPLDPGAATPSQLGFGTQSLTVFVEDVEAHFARAKEAGIFTRRSMVSFSTESRTWPGTTGFSRGTHETLTLKHGEQP